MKITVLQTNNDVKGLEARFKYIEELLAQLVDPGFVVLPELSSSSYIPNSNIWPYKELHGEKTKVWSVKMARKYHCYIGAGYVETDGHDIHNAYLVANEQRVQGVIRKSEGESNIFCRGNFGCTVDTPLGEIGIAICFDAHRHQFYERLRRKNPVLILLPHAWPTNAKHAKQNRVKTDALGQAYAEAFGCPVVFANALGSVEQMRGITGMLMNPRTFKLNGNSAIYQKGKTPIRAEREEILQAEVDLESNKVCPIRFYNGWIDSDNWLFRKVILPFDVRRGEKIYRKTKQP